MKAELKLVPHSVIPGANVCEVHYNGRLVCAIYGGDGPSVRINSRLKPEVQIRPGPDGIHGTQITFPNIEHQ